MGGPLMMMNFGAFSVATAGAADPQLQFFENFPGKNGAANLAYSNGTLSIHAVNIPLSISYNNVVVLLSQNSGSFTLQHGLYSLNASTLSLANSASRAITVTAGLSWVSMATSATQNISPGAWYFGFNILSGGSSSISFFGNSSIAPGNAVPGGFLRGRVTGSTNAMPASIATSVLDITGADAMRQAFIIITA